MKSHGTLRPPRDVHILSWVLSLDKLGYIPCHFKNCSFMAMTLDEMVDHFNRSECVSILHDAFSFYSFTHKPVFLFLGLVGFQIIYLNCMPGWHRGYVILFYL